tara:strand:- start:96 stop:257 length:162 start_codon:yes stop_codon:yes gene_type:complete
MITKIKKIKERFVELLLSEKPIFETLLVKDKNNLIKLLSKLKKIENKINKNKK